jgi:DNA-binding transcriptional LysR family regulator
MAVPPFLEADLLAPFVAVVESGSMTAATRRVGRTQSAVSMQIKRLEEIVGRPLFRRDARKVALTREGELMLVQARKILRAHREAVDLFREDALSGSVTIGTPDDYAQSFLPQVLALFAQSHPKVHVSLVIEPSEYLSMRIRDGSVDLAITTQGNGEEGGVVVHEEPLVWVTSATHDVHERDPLPLAVFAENCCFRAAAVRALAEIGRSYRIAVTSPSIAGVHAALRAGLAVAAEARSTVAPGLRTLSPDEGFPALPSVRLIVQRARGRRLAALDVLERRIVESFGAGTVQRQAA